jgi:hypothetical protein
MAAEGEVGVDPPLQRGQVQLLQPSAFGLAQPHGREVGQRRSPPQRQCDAQPRRGGLKCPLAHGVLGFGQQVLEAVQVEFAIADPQQIPGWPGQQDRRCCRHCAGVEQPTDLSDIAMQQVGGGRGRAVGPQEVDQPIGRHHLVGVQEENCEQRAVLGAGEGDRTAAVEDLHGPKDTKLHPHSDADMDGFYFHAPGCSRSAAPEPDAVRIRLGTRSAWWPGPCARRPSSNPQAIPRRRR